MITEHYFSALGKFLYALCVSDGDVQEKEVKSFTEFVEHKRRELTGTEWEQFVPYFIIMKMSFVNGSLRKQHTHSAASEFIDFLEVNAGKLNSKEKEWAREAIDLVMRSFKGVNDAEEKLAERVKGYLYE